MNVPLRNYWRRNLNPDDWDFSGLADIDELRACYHWEYRREAIQLAANGMLPQLPPQSERPKFAMLRTGKPNFVPAPYGYSHHPDFPKLSYLEHRRRHPASIKPEVPRQPWETLDADLSRIMRDFGHLPEWNLLTPPPLWLGDAGASEIVTLNIPWNTRDNHLVEWFRAWLKARRPKGDEGDSRPATPEPPALPTTHKPTGRGSEPTQLRSKLKALSAWRLLQRYDGNAWKAIAHDGVDRVLGKQYQPKRRNDPRPPTAWSEAKTTAAKILQREFRFNRF